MVFNFPFEYWLRQYQFAGLRLTPVYGQTHSDGFRDEKAVGIPGWQSYVASNEELLQSIRVNLKWGVITGFASKNLYVIDYDLYKFFGTTELARRWVWSHVNSLRDLETVVTLTPRGGLHVWIRSPGKPNINKLERFTYGTFPCAPDLIRGDNQQVLIPPSRLIDTGYYTFLDQDEVLPDFPARIREVR